MLSIGLDIYWGVEITLYYPAFRFVADMAI